MDSVERNLPKIVRILLGVGILRRDGDGALSLDLDLVGDEEAWGAVVSEMEKQGVARVAEGS